MADHSFSNWLPPLSLMSPGNNEQDEQEEARNEQVFMPHSTISDSISGFGNNSNSSSSSSLFSGHQHRPLSPFRSEMNNNVNQLVKLYQNNLVYGNGPLTDDEKSEIARRNESFCLVPEGLLNRVDEDELVQRENENA